MQQQVAPAGAQGGAQPPSLPLLAFQHHVGALYVDPARLHFLCGLSASSDLAIVELARFALAPGCVVNAAVKVWRPFVVASPTDFRELLLEAAKLARLSHPHITRFYGLGCFAHGSLSEVRESMFMVEEYVGARSLGRLLAEQGRARAKNLYSMRTALRWACEVASALAALHEQAPPYVHNDVRADNVFLTDGRLGGATAKLGDLKPHRHVYDREPSTLSQHRQQQRQQQQRQQQQQQQQVPVPVQVAGGRGSCWVAADDGSWSFSSARQDSSAGDGAVPAPPPTAATSAAAGASAGQQPPVQRIRSMPVPIAARRGGHAARSAFSAGSSSWASPVHGAATSPGVGGAGRGAPAAAGNAAASSSSCSSSVVSYVSASSRALTSQGSGALSAHDSGSSIAGLSDVLSPASAPLDTNTLAAEIARADAAADAAATAAVAAQQAAPADQPPPAGSKGDAGSAHGSTDGGGSGGGGGVAVALRRLASRRRSAKGLQLSDSASSTDGRSCLGDKGGAGRDDGGGKLVHADIAAGSAGSLPAAAAGPAMVVFSAMSASIDAQQQLPSQDRAAASAQPPGAGALAAAMAAAQPGAGSKQQQQPQACVGSADALAARGSPHGGSGLAAGALLSRSAPSTVQWHQSRTLAAASAAAPTDSRQPAAAGLGAQLRAASPAPQALFDACDDAVADTTVHDGARLLHCCKSAPASALAALTPPPAADQQQQQQLVAGELWKLVARPMLDKQPQQCASNGQLQKQQQQQQAGTRAPGFAGTSSASSGASAAGAWGLSPSGAASSWGAAHSKLLDLFADVTEEDVVVTRRYRDSFHYTIVPGSLAQHRVRVVRPGGVAHAASAPCTVSCTTLASTLDNDSSRSSDARGANGGARDAGGSAGNGGGSSSGSGSSPRQTDAALTAAASSKWCSDLSCSGSGGAAGSGAHAADAAAEPVSLGCNRGGAPTGLESKQRGGSSALAALTAIDCITEESSSAATSRAGSRDSSAHNGCELWRDTSADKDMQQQQQGSPRSALPQLLSARLTAARSLPAVLSWSGLLQRTGSGACDAALSAHTAPAGCDVDSSSDTSGSSRGASRSSGSGALAARGAAPLQDAGGCAEHQQQAGTLASAAAGHEPAAAAAAACTAQHTPAPAPAPSAAGARKDTAPGGPAAAVKEKRVRFAMERPAGCTASRDFSLLYAAPELVRGERPTEKVDVFAFGVLLMELVSRERVTTHCAGVVSRALASSGRHKSSSRHSTDSDASQALTYAQHQQQHQQQQQQQQQASPLSPRGCGSTTSPFASGHAAASCSPQHTSGSNGSNASSDGDAAAGAGDVVPEHQVLLAYAQAVAAGARPPLPPHVPAPVVRLIGRCWAPEAHERPRMSEVLVELWALLQDRRVLAALDSYVLGLADMGYGPSNSMPGCSCVIG